MPLEFASRLTGSAALALTPAWRRAGLQLGLAWLVLIAVFASDWAAMIEQWWNSSTYNHILLVPAMIAWLAWQRREVVGELAPAPSQWGLLALLAAVLIWVMGALAGFNLLRQAGAAATLPAAALLLLGPRVTAALLFPLAYFVFLVPFGDELVPPLQTITAKLTVWLVAVSQVPATINGVFIDTPAGLFKVAEACSGVKFLIAMIALGVFIGNVCFRSWKRRILFFLLCLVVPILANGIRAWGTIYIAQSIGAERAGGIDHLIYGWVFFALVIAAVIGISWRYFDRAIDDPMVDLAQIKTSPALTWLERKAIPAPLALLAAALITLGGIDWAQAADALSAPLPHQVVLATAPGWQRTDYQPLAAWEPKASGADHRLLGRYADAAGNEVDVFYALYAAQGEGKEAGGFGQGALIPESDWSWTSDGPGVPFAKSDRLVIDGRVERIALTYYRTGSLLTGSNTRLKLANIADRLLLRPRATALLILSAEQRPGHDAARALAAFRAAIGDPGQWMDRIGQAR